MTKLLLLLSLTFYFQGAFAMQSMMGNVSLSNTNYDSLKVLGVANLSKVTINDDLLVTGPTTLDEGCKIGGELKVTGSTKLDSVTINTAKIVGPFDGNNVEAKQSVKIVGPIYCNQCKFHSSLEITAKKATFKDSDLAGITLNKDGEKKRQTLELTGKTIVHGDVILEQLDSEVIIGKEAKILGKIVRGN